MPDRDTAAPSTQLVTGALGFVGIELVQALLADGRPVVGIDPGMDPAGPPQDVGPFALAGPVPGRPGRFRYEGAPGAWELACLDLRDRSGVQQVLRQDAPAVVFHLAAQSSARISFEDPAGTFEANVLGTVSLLEALRRHPAGRGIRVVAVGSAEEYGAHPAADQPLREDRALLPVSPYGVSKVAQTLLCRQYAGSCGLQICVARSFSHTGAGQDTRFAFPSFARQIAAAEAGAGPAEILTGDLTPVRDFLDVRDVVRAYRLLAEAGEPGQVYNVCSGTPLTMAEGLQILVGESRCQISIRQDASRIRPADIPYLVGNNAKLRELTGWRPTRALPRTLQGLLQAARKEYS